MTNVITSFNVAMILPLGLKDELQIVFQRYKTIMILA